MVDPKHIIISRTDSIGDVVLTLPMAGFLKMKFPHAKISFIGRVYTKPVIQLSHFVDSFISWDELREKELHQQIEYLSSQNADWIIHVFPNRDIAKLALKAKIINRVGTSHRLYHLNTCNRWVKFSRKNSRLHEAQLNFKLLKPLIGDYIPPKGDLKNWYGFTKISEFEIIKELVDKNRFNIILHPKSKGSAREWGLDNYSALIKLLPADKYNIFVSGTKDEASEMKAFIKEHSERIVDVTGRFSLDEFICLINSADGIVAASTGPLHIAASLGKKAIGLFAPMQPIHPGRWEPLGDNACALVLNKACNDCKKTGNCSCIRSLTPEMVVDAMQS